MVMRQGERTVVRFSPFTSERLLATAELQADKDSLDNVTPRWGVSCFVFEGLEGESEDEFLLRVCEDVPLNGKHLAMLPESELLDQGVAVEVAEPPPGHVLMGEPALAQPTDFVKLSEILSRAKRRNPGWKRT